MHQTIMNIKRAPFAGALFVFLLLLSAIASAAGDDLYRVEKVIDGDTLILQNNDKVRFLGVNTPELGYAKSTDEPLANQARQFVRRKIEGREIRLENELSRRDKYGRRLARVYTADGQDIQVALLQRGLAFVVAISGDLSYLDRYLPAEKQAMDAGKGVWANDYYAPVAAKTAVDYSQRGYKRVFGTVKRISRSKNYQTLHLQGDFRILISHQNWKQYFKGSIQDYMDQTVDVRGWIFKSHGVTGLKIYHPSMLERSS